MAFTRIYDDECATKGRIDRSTGILSHLMDPNKYYNCNPCRIELGTVGGNNVSLYGGSLVDLESDLRGQTRAASRCPANQYLPGTVIQGTDVNTCNCDCSVDGLPCGKEKCKREKLVHLPSCKMVQYKPRPSTVGYELKFPPCESKGYTPPAAKKTRKTKTRPNPFMPIEWQGQQGARY